MKRVESEPRHEFLKSGFAEMLRALVQRAVSEAEAAESFLAVVRTLGHEITRVLDSLRGCDSIINAWAGDYRRCWDDFDKWRKDPKSGIRTSEAREFFSLESNRWGLYLQYHRQLGAYQLKEDNSKPPFYRMVLELRLPWRAYVDRCVSALRELIEMYRSLGFAMPALSAEAFAEWRSSLVKREHHVGRGAFIAVLEPGLDTRAILSCLQSAGLADCGTELGSIGLGRHAN